MKITFTGNVGNLHPIALGKTLKNNQINDIKYVTKKT